MTSREFYRTFYLPALKARRREMLEAVYYWSTILAVYLLVLAGLVVVAYGMF